MSLLGRREVVRSSGIIVATSFLGESLFKYNPRSQANSTFLPLQRGELSSELLEYANDGIGRLVAKAIQGPVPVREIKLARRKIKLIGHHLRDCELNHALELDDRRISECGAASANQLEAIVSFLQRYDATIKPSDVAILDRPPQAIARMLLQRLKANGLSSFFFDSADCLKRAIRRNKNSTNSTPTLADGAADERTPRLERLAWRPSSGKSSKTELGLTVGQNPLNALTSSLNCVYLSYVAAPLVSSCRGFAGSKDLLSVSVGMAGYLSQRVLRETRVRIHTDPVVAQRHRKIVT